MGEEVEEKEDGGSGKRRGRRRKRAKKMGSPVNQWKNLKIAKLMKTEILVQQAKGIVMIVLVKACVSFNFRAIKDKGNRV